MKRSHLLLIVALTLSACGGPPSAKETAEMLNKIDAANYCEWKTDCEYIGTKCLDYNCSFYVHVDQAPIIKGIFKNYVPYCSSCGKSGGVECRENRCVPVKGDPGAPCSGLNQCQTPGEYLIKSNCPYGSACVSGLCAVVCPMVSSVPDIGLSQKIACSEDADCDCGSYLAGDLASCRCVDGSCVAVVK